MPPRDAPQIDMKQVSYNDYSNGNRLITSYEAFDGSTMIRSASLSNEWGQIQYSESEGASGTVVATGTIPGPGSVLVWD